MFFFSNQHRTKTTTSNPSIVTISFPSRPTSFHFSSPPPPRNQQQKFWIASVSEEKKEKESSEEESKKQKEEEKEKWIESNQQDEINSATIGRATWTFLHTMAAAYPNHPTPTQQSDMSSFIRLFSLFYPCKICADDFQDVLRSLRPPAVQSKRALSEWMCDAHNEVNRRLNKPQIDCKDVLKRWGHAHVDGEEPGDEDEDEDDPLNCGFCKDTLGEDKMNQIMAILKKKPDSAQVEKMKQAAASAKSSSSSSSSSSNTTTTTNSSSETKS